MLPLAWPLTASLKKALVILFLPAVLLTIPGYSQPRVFKQLTVENGLSQSAVMAIAQDQKGFLWFGTRYGLNRYDGVSFKVYKNTAGDIHSLSDNSITALLVDNHGIIWVGTPAGLHRYNEEKDRFERIAPDSTHTNSLGQNYINTIYEDHDNNIWVSANNGVNLLTDRKTGTFEQRFDFINQQNQKGNYIKVIYQDSDGHLWIGTSTGLICIRDPVGKFSYTIFKQGDAQPGAISGDYITALAEDRQKNIWVGTLHNGINRFNKTSRSFTAYPHGYDNIRKLLTDNSGKIWIGMLGGISVLDPVTMQSSLYRQDPENKTSISNNSVHSLYQDKHGTMWIGTYHGGINVVYATATPFTVYQNNRLASSISNNVVSSIVEDAGSNLWIGTEGGGLNYFNRSAGSFTRYTNNPGNKNSISSNLIKVILRDKKDRIWTGTSYGGGLNLYDPATEHFKHITVSVPGKKNVGFDEILALAEDSAGNIWVGAQSGLTVLTPKNGVYPDQTSISPLNDQLHNRNIHALFEDPDKRLWIGTSAGLHMYDPASKRVTLFLKNEGDAYGLPCDNINVISRDSRGRILIGTFYGGLSIYDASTKKFETFTDKDGLPNNNILGIVEDNNGDLWLSTDNGLSRFSAADKKFKTYTVSDGLAGNKFTSNAFLKDSKGELYFGGSSGLTAFFPGKIETNKYIMPVVFTALRLFGNTVAIDSSDGLLSKNIGMINEVEFRHDQSNFTIEYALLNFIKPEKNRYAYMLKGIDNQWNYVNTTALTFTNLPAGNYTLLVKGANNDGVWSETPAALHIHILPPVWQTWWAYALYVLSVLGIVFFILRFFWLRALFKREQQLQQFKLNFFTNISHEIRTHLTLIAGPVEKLLTGQRVEENVSRQLGYVKTNADRLLNLVGELMDFRKAETNNLPLHIARENMAVFAEDILNTFRDMALTRHIQLLYARSSKDISLFFDRRQLEKVVFNLLTNAFKFTPDGGTIRMEITEFDTEVALKITDNGKGIAPENLKKLFVNFFQVEDQQAHNTGYGIGLALSKSIVQLHKGRLSVKSTMPSADTCGETSFTVTLLKGAAHFEQYEPGMAGKNSVAPEPPEAGLPADEMQDEEAHKKPLVLLVEDNNELRAFMNESLSSRYEIVESADGMEGWGKAAGLIPDLIISDVMMPEMDGFSLCAKLKSDQRTNHIPVILLTAKASHDNEVEGFQKGADAYITKPFSIQLLELQVRNLVAAKKAMQQKYSRQLLLEPAGVEVSTVEEEFLQKIMHIIEEDMDNPEFCVGTLATKIAMSQPVLYKKLKALTGMTVNDFVKSVRLKKAAGLLRQKNMNITEVAYAVGFSRRKHFSEEFKKQFGQTPSEYIGSTK